MSEKNVEVMELIETLYTMVTEAWGVPLGNDKCIVERENVLEILNEIKTRIPVELAEAKRLVSASSPTPSARRSLFARMPRIRHAQCLRSRK